MIKKKFKWAIVPLSIAFITLTSQVEPGGSAPPTTDYVGYTMSSKTKACNYWTNASGAISLANPGISGGWTQQRSNVINCGAGSDYTCQVVGCSGTTYSILQYKASTTP